MVPVKLHRDRNSGGRWATRETGVTRGEGDSRIQDSRGGRMLMSNIKQCPMTLFQVVEGIKREQGGKVDKQPQTTPSSIRENGGQHNEQYQTIPNSGILSCRGTKNTMKTSHNSENLNETAQPCLCTAL